VSGSAPPPSDEHAGPTAGRGHPRDRVERSAEHGEPSDDDLEDLRTPMARFVTASKRWLALVVAAALLLPTGAWLLDELQFRRSGAAVVETLEGELRGEAVADTILLVRTTGCTATTSGSGSAFVVDVGRGPVVVTNRHVVDDARQVGVRNLDGTSTLQVARVLVSDAADVAVLEVTDPAALPAALRLAPRDPTVGQDVRLIGFPAARPFTTAGTVIEASATRLLLELEVIPGASGSPVVDDEGLVSGQVYAVTPDGLGVATPAGLLARAIEQAQPRDPC
jgi:S1-C subfamily serine protease